MIYPSAGADFGGDYLLYVLRKHRPHRPCLKMEFVTFVHTLLRVLNIENVDPCDSLARIAAHFGSADVFCDRMTGLVEGDRRIKFGVFRLSFRRTSLLPAHLRTFTSRSALAGTLDAGNSPDRDRLRAIGTKATARPCHNKIVEVTMTAHRAAIVCGTGISSDKRYRLRASASAAHEFRASCHPSIHASTSSSLSAV